MVDARDYHEQTNHVLSELQERDFSLDERTKPRPYKVYRDRPRVELGPVRPPQAPTLSVVAASRADPLAGAEQPAPAAFDRGTLATLCHAANGVVRVGEAGGEPVHFRAASCTGKLYHVDLYLVTGDLPGLDAGVYHFDPRDFGLARLRGGDYRGALARATGGHDGVADAPATAVVTSTWWRNAWKYRARAYRHAFWDSGTVIANLLSAANSLDHRAEVVAGFHDDAVVDLLGLDPEEEAPLELVPLGAGSAAPGAADVEPIDPATEPYSPETVDYPLIPTAWRSSRLDGGEEAASWRAGVPGSLGRVPAGDGERIALDPVDHETATQRPLWNTIRRRRSCREFADASLSRRKLGTVLDRATRGVPGDWNGGDAPGLACNDVYVLATDVDGVPDGAYQFHPAAGELERLGDATGEDQTELALHQEWAGDAQVNVYCMADVDAVVESLGDRGYRLAQLEAGIVLGRLYLATYAHRSLGGTGLTFLDGRVTELLSPRAADQAPMTLFAMGIADDR